MNKNYQDIPGIKMESHDKALASLNAAPLESGYPCTGMVRIGETIYCLPEDCEEPAPSPPEPSEFITPAKENSKSAARAAIRGLNRIVFD